jgi:hypothetical protein
MAKKGSKKKGGVEPFEDDINDEEMEEDQLATKNKNRRQRIEEETEAEDEVEVEDEAEDDEEDEDEEEAEEVDEDEEEAEPVDLGFAPFIIHDDAEWDLNDVIDEAEPGQDIYFFRPPPDEETPAKWFKLQAVQVGEVSEK